ncbi:MAG: ABC transporter substrate-binding protein [Actinomycetales bacterium]|nr:ABC transporter substrate-binding protein [Actinomycetales bacterium]
MSRHDRVAPVDDTVTTQGAAAVRALRPRHRALMSLAATAAGALILTACGGATEPAAEAPAEPTTEAASEPAAEPAPDPCAKENLPLLTAGTLTIGTDQPAYPPWFVDDDPTNGQGYESAVAYAIAEQLGFTPDEVTWTVVPFNQVIAPGPKQFDFDINQVSITDERRQAVDFSSGYYDVKQALITTKGSPIDGAASLADLADAKLGAQIGTTSYDVITEVIKPSKDVAAFDNNDIAKQALANGQIDGLIVDLPTAFYITAVELEDGVIVGQFETTSEGEQFGLVLNLGSPLTTCVTAAVDALRADGTLAAIEQEWLADVVSAPVLRQ